MPTKPTTNNLEWEEEKIRKDYKGIIPEDNNLIKGWKDELAKALIPFIYTKHNKVYFGIDEQELRYEGVLLTIGDVISNIRKKDEEEFIKRLGELSPAYEGEALDTNNNRRWYEQGFGEHKKESEKLIKDYYKK